MNHRGFTLIELMVVVLIIGLLISILLPSVSAAVEYARAASCLSNMRSMCLAMVMYAKTHDGQLPTVGIGHGSHIVDEQGSWLRLLGPYSGGTLAFTCPSDRSPHFRTPLVEGGRLRKVSFGTNYYLSGQLPGYEQYSDLASIPQPSGTVFVMELAETGEYAAADHTHPEGWWLDPSKRPAQQVAVKRHAGRSNFGFMDGHAASHRIEDVYQIGPGSTPKKVNWIHNRFDPTIAR